MSAPIVFPAKIIVKNRCTAGDADPCYGQINGDCALAVLLKGFHVLFPIGIHLYNLAGFQILIVVLLIGKIFDIFLFFIVPELSLALVLVVEFSFILNQGLSASPSFSVNW